MTAMSQQRKANRPRGAQTKNKIRVITAASLFDGHDAAINIMRRLLQSLGAEVIHLGHNRSVAEVVTAALQEDAQAIAVSSYQGGHMEYLSYMIDMLSDNDGQDIRVFAGGGGVIVADEIARLEAYGVRRIFSPEQGQKMGLQGMIAYILESSDFDPSLKAPSDLTAIKNGDRRALARIISALENKTATPDLKKALHRNPPKTPVLGITGTGGSGKSSLSDELLRCFRLGQKDRLKIAILAVDPSRSKTGGALLGDRIRMNSIDHPNIYFRSIASRAAGGKLPPYLSDIIAACRQAAFDLIVVETPGIGQGDADIVSLVDAALYVMTPEFGAQSQLEKIDMLDFADFVAINKFDRKGAKDAHRDVCKQMRRNRGLFNVSAEQMPVFGTTASRFNDDGVVALYHAILDHLAELGLKRRKDALPRSETRQSTGKTIIVPPRRRGYLAEIAQTVRDYKADVERRTIIARERQQLTETRRMLVESGAAVEALDGLIAEREQALNSHARQLLEDWPSVRRRYQGDQLVDVVRGREVRTSLLRTTLSGSQIRKISLPPDEDDGALLRWLLLENLPGRFPYTAGVFAFKRDSEDPTRMFAGEGDAFRTNRRFKALSAHAKAVRLSTAFDSVTLYGCDPEDRPDIYGKVGNSGVSIATLEDMKALYDGFDLCAPSTSVSMTINGPAPTILAMFLNAAIDQQLEKFKAENGRPPNEQDEEAVRAWTLSHLRGTVQADILKEDQGQNTCIFSTEFALKMMGDIQEYFVENAVRNFYSSSISGYHIAEAGANPISQLAFTLANGFTYVEAYLARGMGIDDFAPNLSFFFSNGMDPEYSVMGRVARRIWSTAMRFKYGANERSQKLKYHIQTSGRSLHAQEIDFNDIRTTLQALIAIYDNCNSLHTNAYDEAITTPSEDSARRALAIQLIINREWGLAMSENPNQGSFVIEELTELVEEAVLDEFERIAERGGVLGAMETGYQRGKIQDESMSYEEKKHDGSLPIIGVNSFVNPDRREQPVVALARSTEEEKQSQIKRLADFHRTHKETAPRALEKIKASAIANENIFAQLMDAVRVCSLGQISDALYEVGGKYRRNM